MAIATFASLVACGGSTPEPDPADTSAVTVVPLVRVAPVVLRPVRRTIETSSFIEAEHRVTILSKVSGRVAEVDIDEGDRVQQGQRLLCLDPREAESRLAQARVQLADAKVRKDLAELDAEASVHRVQQAQIEFQQAKDSHARNIESRGLIPEREIEDSGYALEAAEQALRVAEFESRKATLDIQAAQNSIDDVTAKLQDAQLNLDEHRIHAPFDAIVEALHVRGGETIGLSTELLVVVDPTRLVSHLRRPQRELGMVRDARAVTFTTDGWPDREFEAAIDMISPVIDETNGSFAVRIRIAASDAPDLRPGMFLRAKILTENQREALMVPKSAVLNEGSQSVVFVVRDGVARRIVVEPGLEEIEFLEVRNRGDGGVEPNDQVIVSGHRELRDAAAVEIAP